MEWEKWVYQTRGYILVFVLFRLAFMAFLPFGLLGLGLKLVRVRRFCFTQFLVFVKLEFLSEIFAVSMVRILILKLFFMGQIAILLVYGFKLILLFKIYTLNLLVTVLYIMPYNTKYLKNGNFKCISLSWYIRQKCYLIDLHTHTHTHTHILFPSIENIGWKQL